MHTHLHMLLYIRVCLCVHDTHMYKCPHGMQRCIHTCTQRQMHCNIAYTITHTHRHTHAHVCLHTCVHMCTSVPVCMHPHARTTTHPLYFIRKRTLQILSVHKSSAGRAVAMTLVPERPRAQRRQTETHHLEQLWTDTEPASGVSRKDKHLNTPATLSRAHRRPTGFSAPSPHSWSPPKSPLEATGKVPVQQAARRVPL